MPNWNWSLGIYWLIRVWSGGWKYSRSNALEQRYDPNRICFFFNLTTKNFAFLLFCKLRTICATYEKCCNIFIIASSLSGGLFQWLHHFVQIQLVLAYDVTAIKAGSKCHIFQLHIDCRKRFILVASHTTCVMIFKFDVCNKMDTTT